MDSTTRRGGRGVLVEWVYGQHYADERLQGAERVLYGGVLVVLVVDVEKRGNAR